MATGWKATGRRHLSWGIWGNTVKRWRWDKRPPGKSMAATAAECTGSSRQQEELGPLSSHFQNIFFTTIFKSEIEANHSHPPLNSMKWYLLSRLFRDSDMASLSKNKTKNLSAPLLYEPFQMRQATWTLGSLPCPLHQSARLLRSWRKTTTRAGCLQRSVGGLGLPWWLSGPSANTGDTKDRSLIPGWGRSPGGGNSNPLQHICLENPMDRGAWWAPVQRVRKLLRWLSRHACMWRLEGQGPHPQWLHFSQGLGGQVTSVGSAA